MYKMIISLDGLRVELPVLPEEFEVKSDVDNKTFSILNLGEVVRPGFRKLRKFEVKSHFPATDDPDVYVYAIESMISKKCPVRFIFGRESDFGMNFTEFNTLTVIEGFSYKEQGGEVGDIYYSIKFSEYRDYKAKVIS